MNLKKLQTYGIEVFGDTSWRGECPKEMPEQISFLALLAAEFPVFAAVAVHIANEGKRSPRRGAQMKLEGLNKGACDIFIPSVPPILIELKRRDHTESAVSNDQIKYILNAKKIGANACIAVGAQGAMAAVRHYVQQK
jgi:hypothetical protein